jgi:C4-dicarboxylate transporter DctQ subunit
MNDDRRQSAAQGQAAVFESLQNKAAGELGHDHQGEAVRTSWLARLEDVLVGGFALAALGLCAYNVVVRDLFPTLILELVEEVQVYLIVWAVLLSLGSVTLGDRHVKADLFLSMFPPRLRHACEVFANLLGLGFGLLMLWYGGLAAYDAWEFDEVSTTELRFPMWIFIASLPAGGLALMAGYLRRLVSQLTGRS